jgi:hypothetical protein
MKRLQLFPIKNEKKHPHPNLKKVQQEPGLSREELKYIYILKKI